MTYLKLKRAVWSAVAAGVLAAIAGPDDTLTTVYRNDVQLDSSISAGGVQLGPGSGYFFTPERTINLANGDYLWWNDYYDSWTALSYIEADLEEIGTVNVQSTIGAPVAAISASRSLGEKITPPEDWNGEDPIISNQGGAVVWIDYAKELIATEAGSVRVEWPMKGDPNSMYGTTYKTEQFVVSAAPNKRPVRLYWTHKRPENAGGTIHSLQNAGPTVSFSQNYKVDLYPTSRIHIYNPLDVEEYERNKDHAGYVYLDGTELKAFDGTEGTFMIVYSRLDEGTNKRVMLAYEIVEVMEPKQTQIDVKIGDQLKPQTRSFDTNELFPRVTRGLTDEAENDEIYVYQHNSGKQKNYLWAIRDSSENPWKIEVFWRAKEELDVIWPFEVDIYAASWDKTGAQVYVRDTEKEEGGEAKTEPVVYFPESLGIEVMPYQVAIDSKTGKSVKKEHFHVSNGLMYSDWADEGTFALLKYSSGDAVWFQTIRSIPCWNSTLNENLGIDSWGVRTNVAFRTGTFEENLDFLAFPTEVPLGEEIRAPFAAADGFFYPGWIRRENQVEKTGPINNPYNIDLYDYPQSYMATNELYSPIFSVNTGSLEVWWSLPSKLMTEVRPNGGNTEKLNAQIYFPSITFTYKVRTPEWCYQASGIKPYMTEKLIDALPQIVIASGLGSAGYSMNDHYSATTINTLRFNPQSLDSSHSYTGVVTALSGSGNPMGVTSNFTFEARIAHQGYDSYDSKYEIPLISFYGRQEDDSVSANAYLKVGVDNAGNLYLNGVRKTSWTGNPSDEEEYVFPARYAEFTSEGNHTLGGMAIALVRTEDGIWRYYLNNHLVWQGEGPECAIDVSKDTANIFESYLGMYGDCMAYLGSIHYLRLWSKARSAKELDLNRYSQCGPSGDLVFQ